MTLQKAAHSFLDMRLTFSQLLGELGERIEQMMDERVNARSENLESTFNERLGELEERVSALERSMNGHGTSYGDAAGIGDRVSRLEQVLGQ